MGMLGKKEEPQFNAHGAETNSFLRFAHEVLLPRYGAKLGPLREHYTRAVGSLVAILNTIREYTCLIPDAEANLFCDNVVVHLKALEKLAIKCKPKHHLLMELGARRVVPTSSGSIRPRRRPHI